MIEVVDKKSKAKLMAMVLFLVVIGEKKYLLYFVKREKGEVNLFLSRYVLCSTGNVLADDFMNGEREAIERQLQRIIQCSSVSSLGNDGIYLDDEVHLDEYLEFDIDCCYVTTIQMSKLKEIMAYYQFSFSEVDGAVKMVGEKKRAEGFVLNLGLIVMGIFVILFCLGVVYSVIMGG